MIPSMFLALTNGSITLSAILATAACMGGAGAAVVQWYANRGKTSAEEIEIWTRSSVTRLQTMHEEMTMLERRLRTLNAELDHERTIRHDCIAQLRRAKELLALNGIIDPPLG
jgi:hypothetical protein